MISKDHLEIKKGQKGTLTVNCQNPRVASTSIGYKNVEISGTQIYILVIKESELRRYTVTRENMNLAVY